MHLDTREGRFVRIFRITRCLLCVAGLVISLGAAAQKVQNGFPIYYGNSLEYYGSRLPNPIVIYVYSSKAALVGVIDPKGNTDAQALREVEKAITHKDFGAATEPERRAMAESLEAFVSDQGYRIDDIVDPGTRYTLLLTMQKVAKSDCQAYLDVEDRFRAAVKHAIDHTEGQDAQYSAAILEVGSPKSTIRCK